MLSWVSCTMISRCTHHTIIAFFAHTSRFFLFHPGMLFSNAALPSRPLALSVILLPSLYFLHPPD